MINPTFGPVYVFFKTFSPKELHGKVLFDIEYGARVKLHPRDEAISNKLKELKDIRFDKKINLFFVEKRIFRSITRSFYWFMEKSLNNLYYQTIWAILYILPNDINAQNIKRHLEKFDQDQLVQLERQNVIVKKGGSQYEVNFSKISEILQGVTPTFTQEMIMSQLCASDTLYRREVYEKFKDYLEIGESSVYKNLKELEKKNYLHTKHEKKGKGPGRDYIYVNCEKCFFNFPSPKQCFEDKLQQSFSGFFSSFKNINKEEREKLELGIRNIITQLPPKPSYYSKIVRILNIILWLNDIKKDHDVHEIYLQITNFLSENTIYFE